MLSLRKKLILAMLFVGLVPLFGNVITGQYLASNALKESAYNEVSTIRDWKKYQVEEYIHDIRNQIQTMAENTITIGAMVAFSDAFSNIDVHTGIEKAEISAMQNGLVEYYKGSFGAIFKEKNGESVDTQALIPTDPNAIIAQHYYVSQGNSAVGNKQDLDIAETGSLYSQLHEAYHPIFRNDLVRHRLNDMFLIDADEGRVVYTSSKEQTIGIAEVGQAIDDIDETTRKNASIVEQATTTSEKMKEQALKLNELIRFFNVEGELGAKSVAYTGVERRKKQRPWGSNEPLRNTLATVKETPNIAPPNKPAKPVDTGTSWEEF